MGGARSEVPEFYGEIDIGLLDCSAAQEVKLPNFAVSNSGGKLKFVPTQLFGSVVWYPPRSAAYNSYLPNAEARYHSYSNIESSIDRKARIYAKHKINRHL